MFYAKILNCQEEGAKKRIRTLSYCFPQEQATNSSSRGTGNELHQVLEALTLKNLKVSTFPNLDGTRCPEPIHQGPEGRGWP